MVPMSNPQQDAQPLTITQDRIPKIGSMVWFYFAHAFWKKDKVEVFTGKTEIRCRAARVVAVDVRFTLAENKPPEITGLWSTLDVEFTGDDRRLHLGCEVDRPTRRQIFVVATRGPAGIGSLGPMLPGDHHWAFEEMPL
jgi:hypothetical protein